MYENYARLRERKGLTDYAVAKEIGIGRTILSDWKTGKHIPSSRNLKLIADFFDVPVDYLMGRSQIDISAITDKLTEKIEKDYETMFPFVKDDTFMEYINRMWKLPVENREEIYRMIRFHEQETKESARKNVG